MISTREGKEGVMVIVMLALTGAFLVTLGFLKSKQNRDYRELRARFRDEATREIKDANKHPSHV